MIFMLWIANAGAPTLIVDNVLGALPSTVAFIAIVGTFVGIVGNGYDILYPLVKSQVIPQAKKQSTSTSSSINTRSPGTYCDP